MRFRSTGRSALALAFLLGIAACGDSDPAGSQPSGPGGVGGGAGGDVAGGGGMGASDPQGGGGAGPTGPCTVLTPDDTTLELYSAALFSVSARVDLPLEGYAKTRLFLELYWSEATPVPQPGSYDLAVSPDDDYATCEHCVLLVAYDEAGQPRRVFFQESGAMDLSLYDSDEPYIAAGVASDVRLIELSQNEDGSWNLAPGGLCFDLPSWSFDTSIVHGGACESAEDCPNETAQICDVETGTCQPGECSLFFDPPFCDSGFTCQSQYGALVDHEEAGPATGACYAGCEPGAPGTSGDCDAAETCFPLDVTQSFGICLAPGGPAVGESCNLTDIATGCAEGGLCAGEPPTCHAICHYLSVTSGCPSGTYCSLLNLCEPLAAGDDAPVGALCEPGGPPTEDCGPEGDAFRGLCFSAFDEDAVCRRVCKTADPDCPNGLACVQTFSNPEVGLCLDPGACGDGELDLFSLEYCDDGNTQSGDGCSGDCSAAELGPLCSAAASLPSDFTVVGTNDGANGWLSLCDPFLAMPVEAYSFVPPAPGELRLELTSLVELGLSVVADCQDPNSEIACRSGEGNDVLYVNFPTVPLEPALVVVRGEDPFESGLFILQSTFTEAVCGDGSLGGAEACDDGNLMSGDGCSSDCGAIEWPELCASLPVLGDGAIIDATLDGAGSFFDTTGMCTFQSGRDRAYAFVAPTNGTLTVDVSSTDDLSVFISDECGEPDELTYLTCSNSAPAGQTESANALLQAGQLVTVVIDGFTKDDAGSFTLTASFAP